MNNDRRPWIHGEVDLAMNCTQHARDRIDAATAALGRAAGVHGAEGWVARAEAHRALAAAWTAMAQQWAIDPHARLAAESCASAALLDAGRMERLLADAAGR